MLRLVFLKNLELQKNIPMDVSNITIIKYSLVLKYIIFMTVLYQINNHNVFLFLQWICHFIRTSRS